MVGKFDMDLDKFPYVVHLYVFNFKSHFLIQEDRTLSENALHIKDADSWYNQCYNNILNLGDYPALSYKKDLAYQYLMFQAYCRYLNRRNHCFEIELSIYIFVTKTVSARKD